MDELLNQSATQMRRLLDEKAISCQELVKTHIDWIQTIDTDINAVVTECFEHALDTARRFDENSDLTGILTGLPIAHKDLVSTKDLRTTFGSTLYRDYIPATNDYIIDRLQSAGAVTLGKTNVPEFGAGSHTFNRVFGPTCNPYDLRRTCGGSSGGAAAALACRMIPIADGSDLGGSLRNPAAFCNVIGFRPTNNTLPPSLSGSNENNLASLGPMGRSIDDVWMLFNAMLGNSNKASYVELEELPLTGLRVAYSTDLGALPVDPWIKTKVEQVASALDNAGANVENATIDLSTSRQIFQTLRAMSFQRRYADLTKKQKTELKPTILWNVALGEALTAEDIDQATRNRLELQTRVASFFENYDLLLTMTTQVLPFEIPIEWIREIEGVQMDTYIDWMESCSWITTTECPSLSLPAGFVSGLPVGVQLIGSQGQDKRLLQIAKSVELLVGTATEIPPLCGG